MPQRRPFQDWGFPSPTVNQFYTMMQSNRDWLLEHLEPVPDHLLWVRPVAHKNSIGNLLWHINQSERDWIVEWIGGRPIGREREKEFSPDLVMTRSELLDALRRGRAESEQVLRGLQEEDLDRPTGRPGFEGYTIKRAILHVIQHEAYHVGQIVFIREALMGPS